MKIGAHMSAAGGYGEALSRVAAIEGNCLQIFSASPRGWNTPKISPADAKKFVAEKKRLGIDPVYFHASYLINLADAGSTGHLSKKMLIAELGVAEKAGVRGSIVHLGSFKDKDDGEIGAQENYQTLIKNIKEVLKNAPKDVLFLIEDAGTRKIGRRIEEIGKIIRDIGDDRLRVCLDTCHLHAAGYDLRTKEKFDDFLKLFDKEVGLDRLELFHINDSRDPFGSLRDRHENIGEGAVGREVFTLLLNHPKTRNLSFISETPGFDGNGPDKKNLDILRSLVTDDRKKV